MKKEKSCGCIILKDDEVLLIKHNKGHWDFPKGHMEQGETEKQTAVREVKEETNMDVEIISDQKYRANYIIEDKQIDKEVIYFIAKPLSLEIKPQEAEVSIVEWVKIDDAVEKITYPTSKNIMKQVKKDLNI